MTLQRWKITLEYEGSAYCGWQIQEEQHPTIQQSVQKALFRFCQQDIRVQGASRTDAGVHAKSQIAHFDLDYGTREISETELQKALNAHLCPEPISVLNAEKVAPDFHARFGAKHKRYEYRIVTRHSNLTLDKGKVWHLRKNLDVERMQKAAQYLLGEHDFSTFRDSACQANSPIRSVDFISVEEMAYDNFGAKEVTIAVEAQAFLHHQVRNFVGTLKCVGEGKWQPEDVLHAREAKDRTKGGPTAPADGLYLVSIQYTA